MKNNKGLISLSSKLIQYLKERHKEREMVEVDANRPSIFSEIGGGKE